jgi:DNA mismatch endonuclease (patch repair protein)
MLGKKSGNKKTKRTIKMTDVFDRETRSKIMSKIRSKNTKPEVALRRLLRDNGYRFSTYSKLPGTPDIVFRKARVAVFVDGEFWHGYNWTRKGIRPGDSFWEKKLLRNIARDKRVNSELRKMGWAVIRFRETQVLKKPGYILSRIRKELSQLKADN